MGVETFSSCLVHWSCGSQWIGERRKMGKANHAGWSLRRVTRGRAHRDPRGPTPLGPAGTPLVPALTHSTSGAVTGSNARLGTSKTSPLVTGHPRRDVSAATIIRTRVPAGECSDYHRGAITPLASQTSPAGRGSRRNGLKGAS